MDTSAISPSHFPTVSSICMSWPFESPNLFSSGATTSSRVPSSALWIFSSADFKFEPRTTTKILHRCVPNSSHIFAAFLMIFSAVWTLLLSKSQTSPSAEINSFFSASSEVMKLFFSFARGSHFEAGFSRAARHSLIQAYLHRSASILGSGQI